MKITDLMELGTKYNFEGTYSNGLEKYKFIGGKMYTLNRRLEEWGKPNVTSYWLDHTFTVEKLSKRKDVPTALEYQGV